MADLRAPPAASGAQTPTFRSAARVWLKIGLLSFGGPAGQIALMQSEIVDRHRWVDDATFLRGLNFCMALPGPEAQQLATWLGWRMHGVKGGLFAGLAFILPGAALIVALALATAATGAHPAVEGVFAGVKPVVIAIIAAALWRIGRRALKGWAPVLLAVAAFVAIHFVGAPFPLVVAVAALIGAAAPETWGAGATPPARPPVRLAAALARVAGWVVAATALMLATHVAVTMALGGSPWSDLARLFTSAALVTFGGAYAVLPYVAERAVEVYGWLDAGRMVDGLALAETTPGPLILVNLWVGTFAGWNLPGALSPWIAGALGGVLTLIYTFTPSFALVLAGAPHVEAIAGRRRIAGALGAVSAAVVGVIANLAVFLGVAALAPEGRVDPVAVVAALVALALIASGRVSAPMLVALGAVSGLARTAMT